MKLIEKIRKAIAAKIDAGLAFTAGDIADKLPKESRASVVTSVLKEMNRTKMPAKDVESKGPRKQKLYNWKAGNR